MTAAASVPAIMRAVVLTGHGGFDRLHLRTDWPVPQPGPGEVLIRVAAAGVNNTDINTRIGWYAKDVVVSTDAAVAGGIADDRAEAWSGSAFRFPRIQGADVCGRIVSLGAGVPAARLGERVLVDPILRQNNAFDILYLGSERDGGFADYVAVPAANAVPINSDWSDVALASLPCAYAAAENILTRINLTQGERVLVTGASGGVGSAAVQLAKRRGAAVVAIAAGDKADAVRALGANHIVPRGADLPAGFAHDYFDAVVDSVGGSGFPALLDSLKPGGRYGVSGAIAGPRVDLDLRTLYLKDLRLIGCTVLDPQVFPNLVRYVEQGEIKPAIAATYPLFEIVAAQQAFLEKRHVGKIVLTLAD
ncbi:MAG: alcohol dehydrogenase family protein [Chakrabartia sp.]